MWDTLFLAIVVGFAFLYTPGYLVLRAFRLPHTVSAVCAPLVTIVAYSLLPLVYEKIGLACSWESLALPLLGFAVLFFAVLRLVVRPKEVSFEGDTRDRGSERVWSSRREWCYLGLYVGIGVIVTGYVFTTTFDNAYSFVQEFDNVHHINTIRAFVDSGIWSSLPTTLYPPNVTDFPPPFSAGGFYPSVWHCLASLLVDSLGVPVALGANAVNYILCAVVLPSGLFLFARRVFAERPEIVFFGAFVSLAFIAFPWRFLAWGPLFPNLTAFSLLPAVLCCFVSALSSGVTRLMRIASGALFFLGLISFIFTQPNAAFSAGVLLIPFCMDRIVHLCDSEVLGGRLRSAWWKAFFLLLFAVAVVAVWMALFNASFMQGVLSYRWPPFADVPHAVMNILFFSSVETVAQIALGLCVAVGFVYVLAVKRYRWVAASYAIMCFLYVVAALADGPFKQLLTGFWYTDAMRITATMVVVAVPLASAGLYVVSTILARGIKKAFKFVGEKPVVGRSVVCLVALLFAASNFYPGYFAADQPGPTSAFTSSNNFLKVAYSLSGPKLYGSEEIEFIEKVKNVIDPDALVLNEPNDGSVFAYGVNDLNVYYRYVSGWGGPTESEESKTIRRSLDVVASDPHVAETVREIGAQYLLQLDCNGKHDGNHFLFSYKENEWFGIDRVDDDTPGFEIVLSEGDMRLYRILPMEE